MAGQRVAGGLLALAGVAHLVAVRVGLVWVGDRGAVVDRVADPVAVFVAWRVGHIRFDPKADQQLATLHQRDEVVTVDPTKRAAVGCHVDIREPDPDAVQLHLDPVGRVRVEVVAVRVPLDAVVSAPADPDPMVAPAGVSRERDEAIERRAAGGVDAVDVHDRLAMPVAAPGTLDGRNEGRHEVEAGGAVAVDGVGDQGRRARRDRRRGVLGLPVAWAAGQQQ